MVDASLAVAPADRDPRESAFFTANMEAFREYAPHLHVRLDQVRKPHSRLFVDDDGAIDIALGDRRFYGMDAVTYTQKQIDAYFEKPERRIIESLALRDLEGLEGRFNGVLADALRADVANLSGTRVDQASHFAIVFGLGLGLHLDPLIEFTSCVELIIIEPNFDNLYHSLFVADWRALFDKTAQAGRAVHLVLEKDQASIASHLRKLIRLGGPALIDGVYLFQHYPSSLLTEARLSFNRDFSIHILGLGFFEDELMMMANAVENLKKTNLRVLASPQLPRSEPVIICGSGPSIDGNLEVIAAQRDRAIIVSMGSAIRTLLVHGIRPDFHIETENHPENAANVVRAAEEFGLAGITLIGASTVRTVMTEQFDDVILYHRDRQSPTEVFGRGIDNMGSSGPVVANAALVTLAHLGFRNLYLFGVDMGSRQADHYHSVDTPIGIGENKEWASQSRQPTPANFGGDAFAETILNWSRLGFESVLNIHRDIRVVNCSDGARIRLTTPMLPSVLDLPNPPLDHARVIDDIREKLPIFPLELAVRIWSEADLATFSNEIFARFDNLLASAAERDDPGLAWVYELYDLYTEMNAKSPAIGMFLFGTTCMFVGIFWWFDGRIEDDDIRRRFRRIAVTELQGLYGKIAQRTSVLLTDVDRFLAGEISTIDPELGV